VSNKRLGKIIALLPCPSQRAGAQCEESNDGRILRIFINPSTPYVDIKKVMLHLHPTASKSAPVTLDISRLTATMKPLAFNLAARYFYRFDKYHTKITFQNNEKLLKTVMVRLVFTV
jgi:hypothetical protein